MEETPRFPNFLRFLDELFRTQDYILSGILQPEEAVMNLKQKIQDAVNDDLIHVAAQTE